MDIGETFEIYIEPVEVPVPGYAEPAPPEPEIEFPPTEEEEVVEEEPVPVLV